MRFIFQTDAPFSAKVDAIVIPLSEAAVAKLPLELRAFDRTLDGLLTAALALKEFRGEEHTTFTLLTNGRIPAARVFLVGTGKPKDHAFLEWQHIVGTAARALQAVKVMRWALVLPAEVRRSLLFEDVGRLTAKGVLAATYNFTRYKSDNAAHLPAPEEIVVGPFTTTEPRSRARPHYGTEPRSRARPHYGTERRRFEVGAREGTVIAEAMNWMRDFGNIPSSDATPAFLADQASALAKTDKRFRVRIIERSDMEKLGMGALLGVSRGAATLPKCIVLEWRGAPAPRRAHAPRGTKHASASPWYALIGKAITFDSGGISLKPGDKMDEMKFDMSGGAAVLGGLKAIAGLGLRINIVGVIPATDNLPSGNAYKPGDILKTCRGKTLEVLNTDAEGRLVLADAIGYALRYKPKAMVDLATLTGAIVVALGAHFTGLFANDGRLLREVKEAAAASGDRCWPMPLGDAYTREVKSDIADLQNIGKKGREGGPCTAAAFLEQCAEGQPWAHLDIAGTAWATEPKPWLAKGATGVGVHLLVELAKSWSR